MAIVAVGSAVGYLCLASGGSMQLAIFPPLAAMSFVGFPTIRAIVTSLVAGDQAGTALTTLGIAEHVATTMSSFAYSTLFGELLASEYAAMPILIHASTWMIGMVSAIRAAQLVRASANPASSSSSLSLS